jgi:hypothetical protein
MPEADAFADTIINTGPGALSPNGGLGVVNLAPFVVQDIAAKFTLTSATTITSVESWIGTSTFNTTAFMTVAIGINPGSILYSGIYQPQVGYFDSAWRGVDGANWYLAAGDYWVTFLASPGFAAAMPAYTKGAPNPLSDYAYSIPSGWHYDPAIAVGVRISGSVTNSVPDTGLTLVMIALPILVMSASRRATRSKLLAAS